MLGLQGFICWCMHVTSEGVEKPLLHIHSGTVLSCCPDRNRQLTSILGYVKLLAVLHPSEHVLEHLMAAHLCTLGAEPSSLLHALPRWATRASASCAA
jgi:hypothetical protein